MHIFKKWTCNCRKTWRDENKWTAYRSVTRSLFKLVIRVYSIKTVINCFTFLEYQSIRLVGFYEINMNFMWTKQAVPMQFFVWAVVSVKNINHKIILVYLLKSLCTIKPCKLKTTQNACFGFLLLNIYVE